MTEEAGLRRKTITIENKPMLVTEPLGLVPVVAEVVTEVRTLVDGNYAVSLGAFIKDDGNEPEVRITARLRISGAALSVIAGAIQSQKDQIEEAKKASN